jgi:thymidylate kinase
VAALRELLTRCWGSGVSSTSEFGDDPLGSFVAASTGNGRLRLKIGREQPSHVRHLLAISSRVNKIKIAARGGWDAMLFDVFTLSDVAHALADLSTKPDNDVRGWLHRGVAPLLEDSAAIVNGLGFTFYLVCRPAVATRRLAGRLGRSLTSQEVDFIRRLADAYEEVVRERPQVVRVDGEAPVGQVTAEIAGHLERALTR